MKHDFNISVGNYILKVSFLTKLNMYKNLGGKIYEKENRFFNIS